MTNQHHLHSTCATITKIEEVDKSTVVTVETDLEHKTYTGWASAMWFDNWLAVHGLKKPAWDHEESFDSYQGRVDKMLVGKRILVFFPEGAFRLHPYAEDFTPPIALAQDAKDLGTKLLEWAAKIK